MISSFRADMNWRNPVRFQESHQEHVFRLTGSPRGNVFIGFSQRRVRIMRAALRHRLNAQDDLTVLELISKMGSSNCPFWLAKMSVEELMDTLKVKLEGGMLVPTSSIQLLFITEPRTSTPPWGRGKQHPTFNEGRECMGRDFQYE
ncbi:MAG: hypothetical protein ISS57_18750 [Anaerolineales bacterium]|nr:hypothetical protein [Anaerolineales bacterium]